MSITREASAAAEKRIKGSGKAQILRDRITELLSDGMARTGSDIATILGEPILSIRPRLTELRKMGTIQPCGRGKNAAGNVEAKWTGEKQ